MKCVFFGGKRGQISEVMKNTNKKIKKISLPILVGTYILIRYTQVYSITIKLNNSRTCHVQLLNILQWSL